MDFGYCGACHSSIEFKILQCRHSFCKTCLSRYVSTSTGDEGGFACPLCGIFTRLRDPTHCRSAWVEQLPSNSSLENILKALTNLELELSLCNEPDHMGLDDYTRFFDAAGDLLSAELVERVEQLNHLSRQRKETKQAIKRTCKETIERINAEKNLLFQLLDNTFEDEANDLLQETEAIKDHFELVQNDLSFARSLDDRDGEVELRDRLFLKDVRDRLLKFLLDDDKIMASVNIVFDTSMVEDGQTYLGQLKVSSSRNNYQLKEVKWVNKVDSQ